jgi:hypothetical protein
MWPFLQTDTSKKNNLKRTGDEILRLKNKDSKTMEFKD